MELEKSLLRRRGTLAAVVVDQVLGELALGGLEVKKLAGIQDLGKAFKVSHLDLTFGALKFEDGTCGVSHFQIACLVVGLDLLLEFASLQIELFDFVFHLVVEFKERSLLIVGETEFFDQELVLILSDFGEPALTVGFGDGGLCYSLNGGAQAQEGES